MRFVGIGLAVGSVTREWLASASGGHGMCSKILKEASKAIGQTSEKSLEAKHD